MRRRGQPRAVVSPTLHGFMPAASLPPGPRLPGWVQSIGFAVAREPFVTACRRRYGGVVSFDRVAGKRFVMVLDPEPAKQVLHAPADRLTAGSTNSSLRPLIGESSLLLLDGDEHLRARRMLLPWLQGERLSTYESAIRERVDRAIDAWPVAETFALLPSVSDLTIDLGIHVVLGRANSEVRQHIRDVFDQRVSRFAAVALVVSRGRVGAAASGRRFERSRARLDELLQAEIARARAALSPERDDVLAMLVGAHGDGLTDAQLRDALVTLLLAGIKSTEETLLWGLHHLLRNRAALERLRRELAAGEPEYLDAVVREALRAIPTSVGSSRIVVGEPFELSGHALPAGTEINVSLGDLNRHPDHFPDAEAFRPERYLDPAEDTSSWLVFSAGTRRCLGATFSPFELGIVFSRIVQRTELVPVGQPEVPARAGLSLRNGVSRPPRHGVRVMQPRPPKAVR